MTTRSSRLQTPLLNSFAHDFFRLAVASVDFGVVEEVDAVLERDLHHLVPRVCGLLLVEEHPHAKCQLGDEQPRVAEETVRHLGRSSGHDFGDVLGNGGCW